MQFLLFIIINLKLIKLKYTVNHPLYYTSFSISDGSMLPQCFLQCVFSFLKLYRLISRIPKVSLAIELYGRPYAGPGVTPPEHLDLAAAAARFSFAKFKGL